MKTSIISSVAITALLYSGSSSAAPPYTVNVNPNLTCTASPIPPPITISAFYSYNDFYVAKLIGEGAPSPFPIPPCQVTISASLGFFTGSGTLTVSPSGAVNATITFTKNNLNCAAAIPDTGQGEFTSAKSVCYTNGHFNWGAFGFTSYLGMVTAPSSCSFKGQTYNPLAILPPWEAPPDGSGPISILCAAAPPSPTCGGLGQACCLPHGTCNGSLTCADKICASNNSSCVACRNTAAACNANCAKGNQTCQCKCFNTELDCFTQNSCGGVTGLPQSCSGLPHP
jgi:hypothetical protein